MSYRDQCDAIPGYWDDYHPDDEANIRTISGLFPQDEEVSEEERERWNQDTKGEKVIITREEYRTLLDVLHALRQDQTNRSLADRYDALVAKLVTE